MSVETGLLQVLRAAALLLALSVSTGARGGDTREYDWLTNGVKSGSLVVTISEDARGARASNSMTAAADRTSVNTSGWVKTAAWSGLKYQAIPTWGRR